MNAYRPAQPDLCDWEWSNRCHEWILHVSLNGRFGIDSLDPATAAGERFFLQFLFKEKHPMMWRFLLFVAAVFLTFQLQLMVRADETAEQIAVAPTDWAWWRGPNRNGIAAADQTPPLQWDEEKNVLWKSPVPGRGHGSPTVVGDRIFLATADEENEVQSVVCYDRSSGQLHWKTDIHKGGFKSTGRQGNKKSSRASSTVACDGRRLFITFINADAVYLTALSLQGQQLWQKKVTDYVMHQGYGSSPTVYGPLVIASADNKGGGAIVAYDRLTGDVVWTKKRPELPNYASPVILKIAGHDQLLFTGCNVISSFEPLTGTVNWEVEGATTECVTSTVTDGRVVVTSGGYPGKHVSVVRADGTGEVLWNNNTQVYVPSMLIRNGYLYAVADAGIAICYELETGKTAWKHRLGTTFTASPTLVGEHIFSTSDDGRTFIFKADPQRFELIGENKLAEEAIATPTICGSRIYMRVANRNDDRRQEKLYCLAQGE